MPTSTKKTLKTPEAKTTIKPEITSLNELSTGFPQAVEKLVEKLVEKTVLPTLPIYLERPAPEILAEAVEKLASVAKNLNSAAVNKVVDWLARGSP